MSELPPDLHRLLHEHGVDATRPHRVLAALSDGRWWTPRALVRSTAVAHRTVYAVLTALGTELKRDGERVGLTDPGPYTAFARPEPADPVGHLLDAHPGVLAELERLVAEAPRPRVDLDHVAATPMTALRRALFLDTRFALAGRRLLCVGDHDLTSLAATLVNAETEAVVVDIDERMLDYIDTAARRLGLPVRCHFADLRLGLPPSVRGGADLAFTDPPYTPDGVALFTARAVEGLAAPTAGRVLLAYGASETTPGLTAKAQARLSRLNLVSEAVWPDFNRYLGAEAIGAASDLYVLRPTARTPDGGRAAQEAARIYSRGANAKEAAAAAAETDALHRVVARAGADTVVADPAHGAGPDEGIRRIGLASLLGAPVPDHGRGCTAVDLTGGWSALLGRVLLASAAAETHVLVGTTAPEVRDEAGQNALRGLLGPDIGVRFLRGVPDDRHAVVVARRDPLGADAAPEARLLRYCHDRAHGALAAVLREGLVRTAADLGRPINKKRARTAVAAALPGLAGYTLLDLPARRVAEFTAAAAELAAGL
ncbi:bis-aminopropyl spermidine synthase family protein [Murinocardiopsis flavida]|nr:bis-aminopropyl spermidine synthase family protein [Murinocardiopsis flavida]